MRPGRRKLYVAQLVTTTCRYLDLSTAVGLCKSLGRPER